MIAQELALLVPDRILSLTLICTFAGGLTYKSLPKTTGALKFVAYVMGSPLRLMPQKWSTSIFFFCDSVRLGVSRISVRVAAATFSELWSRISYVG